MNSSMEAGIFGVFVSGALLASAIAAILQFPARSLLMRLGVYRVVWHRNLFDTSVFFILWGLVVWLLSFF